MTFFRVLNLSKKADNVKNIPYFDEENVKFVPFYGGWKSRSCLPPEGKFY